MPRRPEITFETVTPSLPEALPRMDVAAFVGFATRGPIDVPVPVEDLARFRDVFGSPLELVRDVDAERVETAHLHRAVEAFFRNGGRRCWVVRVAQDADEASPAGPVSRTTFGLPGLVSAETGRPTTMRARCYGATFNALRVGTVLHRRLLPDPSAVEAVPPEDGSGSLLTQAIEHGLMLSWTAHGRAPLSDTDVVEGDLLRIAMDGGVVAVAPVAQIVPGTGSNEGAIVVQTAPAFLFMEVPGPLTDLGNEVGPLDITIPARSPVGTDARVESTGGRTLAVRRATADDPLRFQLVVVETLGEDSSGTEEGIEDLIADLVGQVVHLAHGGSGLTGWLQLGEVLERQETGGEETIRIEVQDALWPVSASEIGGTGLPTVESVQRLRFDLLAWNDQELKARLDDLGFVAAHPRAWMALPVDKDLFALRESDVPSPAPETLRADAFVPRFPLASPAAPGEGPFVPLGMADRPNPDRTLGRLPPTIEHSRLAQERLGTFATDVFLDADLSRMHTAQLGEEANRRFYVEEDREEPAGTGLHSLWPIEEVTLLSMPDAVHRGWDEPRPVTPDALPAPAPLNRTVAPDAEPPRIHLSWTVRRLDEEDVEVEVQEAQEPTFENAVVRYRGTESSIDRYVRRDDPVTLFFRYRVVADGRPEPWSNTRSATLPEPDFDPCAARPGVPAVARVGPQWMTWTPLPEPAGHSLTYDLQIDRTPTFHTPSETSFNVLPPSNTPPNVETIGWYKPTDRAPRSWYKVLLSPETPSVRYVRLRARLETDGRTLVGGWSRTLPFVRALEQRTPVISTEEYENPTPKTPGGGREGLLNIQRAMLRFAAARGDVLAVLTLPETDQSDDARRHTTRLRTPGAVLDYGEGRTLSYGALYYPWLLGPVGGRGQIASTPPDGAVCGMIANRTLRDGAWMAPANVPIADVPTVTPPLTSDERTSLEASPVNVFAETPDGVLTLGTATLARDPDLEPITTRRLLILVRRLVRREGPELVFENNTPRLRQRIAEQFDEVLRRLFRRGAFAGAAPSEGYRVVADQTVNPPGQVERGRLAVEIRIAPAEPLTFITVRLVQRGDALTIAEAPAAITV